MRIISLKINNFRLFKNQLFKLGKYITVFSGTNAVGKSTILGMLGNSSELKVKDGRPILQKQFRTEFSEIFKMSQTYDPSASNIAEVDFDDKDKRIYRITWQTRRKTIKKPKNEHQVSEKLRPRIIPEYVDSVTKRKHSQKKNWPTLFLGLSRLFPLGESDTRNLTGQKYEDNDQVMKEERERYYKYILSINSEIREVNTVSLDETSRKKVVGITTNTYDYLSNSSGQDNLGQIMLAVDSFRLLQKKNPDNYSGGLLLIDELEATLHPSAQNRLFDYLLKSAKKLDLQIVFTTHSLSLLGHICKKIRYNQYNNEESNSCLNDIELYYLSIANGVENLNVISNPEYSQIEAFLYENPRLYASNITKVKILSEDNEARWLITKLLEGTDLENKFELLPIKIGKDSLLSLAQGDPLYVSSKIIVLDGDADQNQNTKKVIEELSKNKNYKICMLPGKDSPEKVLFHFLDSNSENAKDYFNQDECIQMAVTKNAFHFNNKINNDYVGRDALKEWFKDYKNIFEQTRLIDFFIEDNKKEILEFRDKLNQFYECILKYCM